MLILSSAMFCSPLGAHILLPYFCLEMDPLVSFLYSKINQK